ncbi:hypothetical protein NEOLEDRAFT_1245528 [Neolentinus lepideus HHB14362 ss-1]|uniref:C3H1-type domain-containing protein n=1 Tax=Neolentinus lepideus HHB14362 ss-1 TaxID=1314782 RepID=A0A165NPL0_9AGAM|nr:hypothetical protein NEOLEDRAFT_1245528 [Neolentinus lepideus HHB14362 ss-1]
MPVADKDAPVEYERADSREKGAKGKSSGKAKDLSHVPCKFFKVGSCTAGSSCPFSHSLPEPGQPKDVCAWFVKGNCKFGHKCALAHILPGQPMAMDRKNKKAAQMASASSKSSGTGGGGGNGGNKRSGGGGVGTNGAGGGGRGAGGLLSGSTAPTRPRPPMPPLKAAISPSAPAPPLKDTDFASFADVVGEDGKLPSAPATRKSGEGHSTPPSDSTTPSEKDKDKENEAEGEKPAPPHSPLPVSTPTAPRRLSVASPPTANDLGPIGSPSKHPSLQFSPGTSPFKASSPPGTFSAPGPQAIFKQPKPTQAGGVAMSLGAWGMGIGVRPNGVDGGESAVEEEDLEEFIPGSLSDLLTPEERSRRMSRTATNHLTTPTQPPIPAQGQTTHAHHRYSRSVPSASLLSIWSPDAYPSSPSGHLNAHLPPPGLGNGSPSSFTSASHNFGGRVGTLDVEPFGISLSPSNASAAFLPGLHHHYKNSKQQPPTMSRIAPSSLYSREFAAPPPAGPTASDGLALSPPRYNAFPSHPGFDSTHTDIYLQPEINGKGGAGGGAGVNGGEAFSPSTRALQSHAPGQSLPQGLAAGYSRIHARPAPVNLSGVGSVSPGATARDVLDSMMSRLSSYSVARSPGATSGFTSGPGGIGSMGEGVGRGTVAGAAIGGIGAGQRSVSGRSTLSPLSGPVLTGDVVDDDLFSMDG